MAALGAAAKMQPPARAITAEALQAPCSTGRGGEADSRNRAVLHGVLHFNPSASTQVQVIPLATGWSNSGTIPAPLERQIRASNTGSDRTLASVGKDRPGGKDYPCPEHPGASIVSATEPLNRKDGGHG